MKKKLFTFLSTSFLALLMFALPVLFTTLNSKQTIKNSNDTVQSRTIIADGSEIDCESVFNSFEDPNLETDGSVTTFEGSQTINLSDLDGLDEVSQSTLEGAQLKVKYRFTYDKETNLVTLTAVEVHQDLNGTYEETIVDTILGAAFVNEAGNLDAVLEVDGDYILLSELQDLGMVENCGWFRNLFNKVAKAVKKVTQTTIGIIGAVATVAVPVAIGVICAATGVGLIATVAMGAVAGATIASGTAMASTKQQDGKVDWKTVGVCAGVGAAVGAIASGVSYGFTKLIKGLSKARIYSVAFAIGIAPLTICSQKLNYVEALSVLAVYKVSVSLLEGYGLKLIPERLFTNAMLESLQILKNSNVGGKYLGVYTPSKVDAAKLAFALGGVKESNFDLAHGTGGYYQHYHDKGHKIHVWFGLPV